MQPVSQIKHKMAKQTKPAEHTTPAVNDATAATPATPAAPAAEVQKPAEPTNAKIEELKVKRTELRKLTGTFEPDSKERDENEIEIWKIGEAIKAEVAAIKAEEAEAAKKAQRAEKLAKVQEMIDLHIVAMAEGATDEQKDAAKKAREVIENIVLGQKSSSGTGTTTPSANGAKGQTTAAIRAYARPILEGATRETVAEIGKKVRKELLNQGFNDGTMNAAVLNLEKELGLKD